MPVTLMKMFPEILKFTSLIAFKVFIVLLYPANYIGIDLYTDRTTKYPNNVIIIY
jgi:hypothetical protein